MADLLNFVRQTFFAVPGEWLRFYPDPIDSDRYDREWADLCGKIEKSWEAYKSFRLTVKNRLTV